MVTMLEVSEQALLLPEKQRARLAAQILDSLPPFMADDDEGWAEAERRAAELDANPALGITLSEFENQIRAHHPRP